MARVRISWDFADGDTLSVTVSAGEGYPDQLDQACGAALRLFSESLAGIAAVDVDEEE